MHRKVFITGASSGIGSALVRILSSEKVYLVLTGRNEEALIQISEEAKGLGAEGVEYFVADLGTPSGLEFAQKRLMEVKPDLLINNAGFGLYGDVIDLSLKEQERLIDIDVKALFSLAYTGAKTMVENGIEGVIMNVSSIAAYPPFPGFSVYSASKAFVNQLTISMDYELRSKGVRVLASCPGVVITRFRERAGGLPRLAMATGEMTAEYAAGEIWKQIKRKKQIHIFNWRYRILMGLTRILPNSLVARLLHMNITAIKNEIT